MPIFQEASYPFPSIIPKFLGTIIQKYRIRNRATAEQGEEEPPTSGTPAAGFKKWIDEINSKVRNAFVPVLRSQGMMLPDEKYRSLNIDQDYCLASISDFNSLIAKSQEHQVPVFTLTDEQIGLGGVLLERTKKSKDMFESIFSKLGDMVVELTSDVSGT
jgi:hypothetical protein